MNNSYISNISSNTVKKKYNLKEKFNLDSNMTKFQEFLNSYNATKNILLFVDSKNNFWEILKRNDLSMNIFMNNYDNITSITSKINANYNLNNKFLNIDMDDHSDMKFDNLEIKEDNRSLNNSELDISRVTDCNNFSHFIRDMNDA
jgi:hypothetical protein